MHRYRGRFQCLDDDTIREIKNLLCADFGRKNLRFRTRTYNSDAILLVKIRSHVKDLQRMKTVMQILLSNENLKSEIRHWVVWIR